MSLQTHGLSERALGALTKDKRALSLSRWQPEIYNEPASVGIGSALFSLHVPTCYV